MSWFVIIRYNVGIVNSKVKLELCAFALKGKHNVYSLVFSAAILDVRKSLSIAFLAISDRSAILDVRNSLSIAFLAISDPYGTELFDAGGHFGRPKITFDRISGHFRSIRNFFFDFFFDKMAAGGHFGWDVNVNYRTRPRYLDE